MPASRLESSKMGLRIYLQMVFLFSVVSARAPSTVKVGGPARRGTDVWSNQGSAFLHPRAVPVSGVAFGFSAYFLHPQPVTVQLWRPRGRSYKASKTGRVTRTFELLHQWELNPIGIQCRQDFYLKNMMRGGNTSECVRVQEGDYLGAYSSVVPWGVAMVPMEKQPVYSYLGEKDLKQGRLPREGDRMSLIQLDLPFWFSVNLIMQEGTPLIYRAGSSADCPRRDIEGDEKCEGDKCPPVAPLLRYGEVQKPVGQGRFRMQGGISLLLQKIHVDGVLVGWEAYFLARDNARESGVLLQLWRPADRAGRNYTLLAQKSFLSYPTHQGQKELPFYTCYRVYPGDQVGLSIPLGKESSIATATPPWPQSFVRLYEYQFTQPDLQPEIDDLVTFNMTNHDRSFSAAFFVDTELARYNNSFHRCRVDLNMSAARSYREVPKRNISSQPDCESFILYSTSGPHVMYLIGLIMLVFIFLHGKMRMSARRH